MPRALEKARSWNTSAISRPDSPKPVWVRVAGAPVYSTTVQPLQEELEIADRFYSFSARYCELVNF